MAKGCEGHGHSFCDKCGKTICCEFHAVIDDNGKGYCSERCRPRSRK